MQEKIERNLFLYKICIKRTILIHVLVALVIIFMIMFFQGVSNLDAYSSAKCLECYIALIGIPLLVPISQPEESIEIREVLTSKIVSIKKIWRIRFIIRTLILFILVFLFALFLKKNNCIFPFKEYVFGTFSTALFLGTLGILFSKITYSTTIGYMVSIGYYVYNLMTKGKLLGKFYLFSMYRSDYLSKWFLILISFIFLLIVNFNLLGKKEVIS